MQAWLAFVGAVAFATCALIARSGHVGTAEGDVFHDINNLPERLYPLANVLQQAGNLAAALVVAAIALACKRFRLGVSVLLATGLKLGVERVIKVFVVRERPGVTDVGAVLRGNVPAGGQSFVSGHAIVITMLAVILLPVLPRRWRLVPPFIALGVMVARVYVGAHNPLDVLGGAAIGVVIGAACSLVLSAVKPIPVARVVRVRPGKALGRHPGDLLRVGCAGAAVVVTAAAAATHHVTMFEEDVFRLINRLPEVLHQPLNVVMQAGALAAVPVVATAALARRRVRLARDVALAGTSAWVAAKILKSVVGRERPFTALEHVFRHVSDGGLGYPSGHAAVAAAIATAASPYLTRRFRRWVWVIAFGVGIARIYVGAHLPLDVIGGWALGWLIGSVIHLALGAPNGSPDQRLVTLALESVVGPVHKVHPLVADARGSMPYTATLPGGGVFAKVVTRQHRDADVIFKLTRFVMLRHREDEAPFVSPQHEVEHEAYVTLMAERAGARTTHVRGTGRVAGASIFVTDLIGDARGLDQLPSGPDNSAVLVDAWRQIDLLHRAGIAHRDLRLANLIVGVDGLVRVIDFGFAEVSASDRLRSIDVAEFLVSSALAFGVEPAVDAAARGIGMSALQSALPFIQPLALSAATRARLRHVGRHTLEQLRAAIAARTGVEVPELQPLARIKPFTLLMLVGLGVGVHFLLPQIGELSKTVDALKNAQWPWLAGALAASAATYVFAAVALMGAAPIRLPFGRTLVAEGAVTFANRFSVASIGGIGVTIRYLQRHGLDATAAATTVATVDLGGFTVHLPLLVLAGYATGTSGITDVHLPSGWHVLIIAVAGLAIVGAIVATPWRHRIRSVAITAIKQLGEVAREPKRAAQLWVGSLGVTTFNIVTFACALAAFSANAPFAHVAFVYLAGVAVASAAPTPGGLGAVEAALVAGLTATGVEAAPAIAGVLVYRLASFWLPAIPGWVAFHTLRRRHEL